MNFSVRSFFSFYYFSEQFNPSFFPSGSFICFESCFCHITVGYCILFLSQLYRKVCIPVFSLVAIFFAVSNVNVCLASLPFVQLFMLLFHYFHCHHILFAMRFAHEYELKFKAFIYCACIVCGEQYQTLLVSLPLCSTFLHSLRAPRFF